MDDVAFLHQAIDLAAESRAHGNHPFGALLVNADGEVVCTALNTVDTDNDPTGHAETNLVRVAGKRFDPDHRMRGANFILCAVEGGRTRTRDDYGNGSVSHTADTLLGGTDDVLEAAGREEDGRTTVEFVIPLATRDPYDKSLVPGETYGILVAYHETSDNFATRHSRRGSGTIRLDKR